MMNLRYIIRNGEKVLQQQLICYHQKDGTYFSSTYHVKGMDYINITHEWQDIPTVKEEDNE